MRTDLVSVIIPVYNVSQYLDRCMESVVGQSYKELEIILIDDGSTDGSGEKCRQWSLRDQRVVLISKNNEGLGMTRNCGIRQAKGEYIIFIDSDDWWEQDTVEKMYAAARKYDADIVYMDFYFSYLDKDGEMKDNIFIRHFLFDGVLEPRKFPELIFDLDARMWSKLFRRCLFVDKNIYMPSHPFEDFPVMPLLAMNARKVCQVHEPLYHYFYQRKDNIIGNVNSYRYINTGINELYEEFVERGYERECREPLKAYMYSMCKFALNDLPAKKLPIEEYKKYVKPFLKTIKKLIPEKVCNSKYKTAIWGSYSNRSIVFNLLTKQNQNLGHYMFSSIISLLGRPGKDKALPREYAPVNAFRSQMLEKELNQRLYGDRMENVDYIFVDLLEETNKIIHVEGSYITYSEAFQEQMKLAKTEYEIITPEDSRFMELWKEACGKFISYFEDMGIIRKVILLKLFLSESFGVDSNHKTRFGHLEEIQTCNKVLASMYEYFEEKANGRIRSISMDGLDNYTYQYTKYGCLPVYYNGKFHMAAAQKIESELWGNDGV